MKRKASSQARLQKTICPFQVLEWRGREEGILSIKAIHLACFGYVLIGRYFIILKSFFNFLYILVVFFPYHMPS